MTIVECIKTVLSKADIPMSSKEIYEAIVFQNMYSFGAQDPVSVVNGQIRRRCVGLDFPTAYPNKIFEIAGQEGKVLKYQLVSEKKIASFANKTKSDVEKLPEEMIESGFRRHVELLRKNIFNLILDNTPEFFEHLVIDLLLKMGYGYDINSGIVTGKSHDGGIDGVINEDKLGLGLIYVQAKRYSKNNKVGRKEIQAFIGAMEHIQKGVFITTSSFTKEAISFAEKQQQKHIKLIDGESLTELLIKNEIGIQAVYNFKIYKIDIDYYGNQ